MGSTNKKRFNNALQNIFLTRANVQAISDINYDSVNIKIFKMLTMNCFNVDIRNVKRGWSRRSITVFTWWTLAPHIAWTTICMILGSRHLASISSPSKYNKNDSLSWLILSFSLSLKELVKLSKCFIRWGKYWNIICI